MIRAAAVLLFSCLAVAPARSDQAAGQSAPPAIPSLDARSLDLAVAEITRGRRIFRHDTFGNEAFWGDQLRLHESIAGRANGGTGPGLSPSAALKLGLKVDANALPAGLKTALREGRVDLDDPATTLALLKLDAVVGVRGLFDADQRRLRSVGITCALCH